MYTKLKTCIQTLSFDGHFKNNSSTHGSDALNCCCNLFALLSQFQLSITVIEYGKGLLKPAPLMRIIIPQLRDQNYIKSNKFRHKVDLLFVY